MRVGVDASFPPFAVDTGGYLFGADIDLGRALAQRLGIPIRFVNMGYDGLYDSLKADQVDVLISALLVDPSRTRDVLYTRHYFNNGLVLVSRGDAPLRSWYELPGHTIAYEYGSDADQHVHTWLRQILPFNLHPYELPAYALDAIRLSKADAALVQATDALLYLQRQSDWGTDYHYVSDAWFAAAVRIDHTEMWDVLNEALQAMDDDGTLDAILSRWL
jgi:polar amino acid transport system substrate-binding protein